MLTHEVAVEHEHVNDIARELIRTPDVLHTQFFDGLGYFRLPHDECVASTSVLQSRFGDGIRFLGAAHLMSPSILRLQPI